MGYLQSLLLFCWEEILSEVVHTAQVMTHWTSVSTRRAEGQVEDTKESAELSSGHDMKQGGQGLCLATHGVSQRKQVSTSADGDVKCFGHCIFDNAYNTMDGWAHRLGRRKERGRDPEKALTRFTMTAYISMDF